MTKRILSCLLVLAMLVSVVPAPFVSAEGAQNAHTHSDAHACGTQCGGNVVWKAWTNTGALPTESGHYYLTDDVQLTATNDVAAGLDITICLNGYDLKSASDKRIGYVYGKLTIADCTAYTQEGQYISGSVVGSTAADGAVLSVRRGGTLVLEDGIITGGTTTGTAGGGGVYLQKGTSAGAGGVFYMYGGEISGNEGQNGGGVCIGGADSGCVYPAFYMYGGTITGNAARANGGGVYAVSRSTVEITNGTVTGNTAATKAASVYMDGGYSKLTVSGCVKLDDVQFVNSGNAGLKVNGLTNGTQITMTTVATDMTKIVSVASGGKQESWSAHWVTANGESVSVVDGAFVSGHYHGDIKYQAYVGGTNHNTLPTGGNRYYLTNDIVRNASGNSALEIAAGNTQYLCLNGHTITHRNPSIRLYNIKGNYVLEDCSAYTDAEGNYISGGITYGGTTTSTMTNGMLANVSRGGSMTIVDGQIYGFTSELASSSNAPVIYLQGANTTSKAVFNMQGGQIHSNKSATNGAVILVMKADPAATTMDTYTQINISGGKIWGNTSTSGGIIAAVSNHINITGGTITGNTVKNGAVYGRNENNISVSGNPTIYGNNGGDLYITGDRVLNVGDMTGGKIGIGAAQISRKISTQLSEEDAAYFVNDNGELTLKYVDGCLYLGASHEHGLDGHAGTVGWTKWTSTTSLPTEAGSYYLTSDVQMSGTVTISANVDLCLNGKTITAASGKRVFTVGKGATVTLTDCCDTCGVLTGGSYTYGSAISVSRGGVLNMYNGKITGNTASEEGAVYVQSANDTTAGAIFNMYGGEISGNTGKKGGAITPSGKDAQVNIYGGIIQNNHATKDGGAIYVYDGAILRLAGGQIMDNTALLSAGGVYVSANAGKVLVEGTPVVKQNKNGQQNNNIYLLGGSVLEDAGLQSGAELCVTAQKTNRAISSLLLSEEAANCFYSDSIYFDVVEQNGYISCIVGGDHGHCDCVVLTNGCTHLQNKWQAWESTNSLPTASGYYYLLGDVQLTGAQTVAAGEDVHLCLNGKTVTAAAGNRVYSISTNAKLAITDCTNTGKLTGGNKIFGGAINVSRGATFNMYGGILTGNTSQTADGMGGAVYVQAANTDVDGGVFNMYGGKITGNSANKGGAISTGDGAETTKTLAQINIYGGTISDNQSAENGGAIRTGTYGLVNIYGGTISGNHCQTRGGAIYMGKNGKLDIQGGVIANNTTVTNGAAIYTLTETTISGGEIKGNVSGSDGGALYASGTTLEISGGTFSGNKVTKGAGGAIGISSLTQAVISGGTITENTAANGGAIIAQGGADLTIKGGTISKNEATIYAGAIYVNVPGKTTGDVSVLTIEGGTITQNKSVKNGGGIYITEAKFVMTGGEISKNESPTYGGGVFAIRTTSKVTGGTISGNVSTKDGAGAYFNAGTAEVGGNVKVTGNDSKKGAGGGLGFTGKCQAKLTGGTVTNNIAGNAGGIIVQGQAHLVMNGGSVSNNNTRQSGGGIYVNKSSMDFNGGTVSGNKSVKNGGGIYTNASDLRFAGTNFTANKAEGSGGGVFVSKGKIIFTGGTFSDNISERYAGGVYLSDTESTVSNIKVTGNSGVLGSGGFHCYKGTVTMNKVEASGNNSDTSCGGVYATQFCNLTMNDCLVEKNTSPRGAGVMANARASLTMNNVVIRYNEGIEGAGIYINSNVTNATINDCEIIGNIARKRLSTTNTMILGVGAGIYMKTATKTSSGQSILYVNNTVIRDNEAEGIGGGAYVAMQMHMYLDGCTIENNKSGDMGAGIYQESGSLLSVKNTDIIGNTGAGNGSAIYAGSDFTLDGGKITGNKTTDGTAVYLAPARYDGHSYTNATIKIGGDLQICDNQGTMEGDLYFDEGVAAAGTVAGFGENTKIKIQLHSGVLTNTLLAAYHYEGGDQVYTVTYGDRSLTEPEYEGEANVKQPSQEPAQDIALYAIVGAVVLAIAAAVVLLATKKKKAAAAANKE